MSALATIIRALVDAGASAEQVAAAVEAAERAKEARRAALREGAAERQRQRRRRERLRSERHGVTARDPRPLKKEVSPGPPLEKISPTPRARESRRPPACGPAVAERPAAGREVEGNEAKEALVFVSADSEAGEAWRRHWLATRGVAPPRDRRGGWHFASRWPPSAVAHGEAEIRAPP